SLDVARASPAGTAPIEPVAMGAVAAGTALAFPRGGGLSSTHAMPWNHLWPGGSSRWGGSPHRACAVVFPMKLLVGGVARNAKTVAAAMTAVCPQCLASTNLSAVPNDALMRVSITSTE